MRQSVSENSREEIEAAYKEVPDEDIEDIKKAAANIRAFAKAQRETMAELKDFSPAEGILLGHRIIPVDSCCCYVPGGGYPLYSTALMLGIPAKAAGVKRVTACSPVIKARSTSIRRRWWLWISQASMRSTRRRSTAHRGVLLRNGSDPAGQPDRGTGKQLRNGS